jgi:DNA invertase Pin-like site-specific DNA recombinase
MTEEAPAEPETRFPVGYARVSMEDQDNARQIEELTRYGVNPADIFTDKASGASMDRPGWQALWKDIRECDTVVILSLDRLGSPWGATCCKYCRRSRP